MDANFYEVEGEQNSWEKASLLSQFSFWYTIPIFLKGRKGQLSVSDVYRCSPDLRAAPRGDQLAQRWKEEIDGQAKGKKPSLLRAIMKIHAPKFLVYNLIFAVVDSGTRLSTPLCLEGLINYFSPSRSKEISSTHAYLYALGVVSFMCLNAVVLHPMLMWLLVLATKIRVGCCSLVYRKLLRLDAATADGAGGEGAGGGEGASGAGRALSLITGDAMRFDMACLFLVDLLRTPIECSLIVYLMYRQIGPAALLGVAFLLLFIPLQGYLGKVTGQLRRRTAVRTDRRIALMTEVLQNIEAIKIYVWEDVFADIVGKARRKEMKVIKKMSWVRAVMISCVKLNTKVAILLSIIAFISFGNDLTAAKVFVIFSYYDILRYMLVDFLPLAITFTLEAYVSVQRIQQFLLQPELDPSAGEDLTVIEPLSCHVNGQQTHVLSNGNVEEQVNKSEPVVVMKALSAQWLGPDGSVTPALTDIDLTIKAGSLTVVMGAVGSGKSALLLAMLREVALAGGHLDVRAPLAYAPQEPWIFDASIRQNVTFGAPMDPRRYRRALELCELRADLRELTQADFSAAGERGAGLSGGQRARLALARCVYARAGLCLLDDALAAVDARVATALLDGCVLTLRAAGAAVVLVSHDSRAASLADQVVVMDHGRIIGRGSYEELRNTLPHFDKLMERATRPEPDTDPDRKLLTHERDPRDTLEPHERMRLQRSMSKASQLSYSSEFDDSADPKREGEAAARGVVSRGVYARYLRSGGGRGAVVSLLALFALAQLCHASVDLWLREWVNLEETNSAERMAMRNDTNAPPTAIPSSALLLQQLGLSREQCVSVYAALLMLCALATWSKLLLFYNLCVRASVTLHDDMFRGVTNAPMWFFHHNPSGRVLNRFSKDMGQVDTLLPIALVDCFGFFFEVVSILVVVCVVNWWLLLPTALLAALLLLLRELFLRTSRDLKRMEAIVRGRALAHMSSTSGGGPTVRAFGRASRLAREFDKLQDAHSGAWLMVIATNQAFGLWMDVLCCLYLAIVTASFFVFADGASLGGSVGLAVTQVIGLVGMCQYGMRQTAEVENQMTSVERIIEYSELPAESPVEPDERAMRACRPDISFDQWPDKGELKFEDVYVEYERPPGSVSVSGGGGGGGGGGGEGTVAVRGVSLAVRPGEKVAVVGRTGAGKSSLLAALFGLARVRGRVSVDGASAREAGLRAWRGRLSALPQRPALFAGSLRHNLDPRREHSDERLARALRAAGLADLAQPAQPAQPAHPAHPAHPEARLGQLLDTAAGALSGGQRQLAGVARAVLAARRLLVLDEPTASVDAQTDKHIQETIRSVFADTTVLTIAHRLDTVMDYDRVVVMDRGRIVESGHPYELLTGHGQPPPTSVPGQQKVDTNKRRSLLSKTNQAPLALPENFTMEKSEAERNETIVLMDETHACAAPARGVSEPPSPSPSPAPAPAPATGAFQSLVAQAGPAAAAALYRMAEESYKRMLEKKNS